MAQGTQPAPWKGSDTLHSPIVPADDSDSDSTSAPAVLRWHAVMRKVLLRGMAASLLLGRPFLECLAFMYPSAFDAGNVIRHRQSTLAFMAQHMGKAHISLENTMKAVQKQMKLPPWAVLLDPKQAAAAATGLNALGDVTPDTLLPPLPLPAAQYASTNAAALPARKRPVWRWHLQVCVDGAWRALLSDKDLHVALARHLLGGRGGGGAPLQLRVAVGCATRMEPLEQAVGGPILTTLEHGEEPTTSPDGSDTAVTLTTVALPDTAQAEGAHFTRRRSTPLTLPAMGLLSRTPGNDKGGSIFGAPPAKARAARKRATLAELRTLERQQRRARAEDAARRKKEYAAQHARVAAVLHEDSRQLLTTPKPGAAQQQQQRGGAATGPSTRLAALEGARRQPRRELLVSSSAVAVQAPAQAMPSSGTFGGATGGLATSTSGPALPHPHAHKPLPRVDSASAGAPRPGHRGSKWAGALRGAGGPRSGGSLAKRRALPGLSVSVVKPHIAFRDDKL